MTQRPELVKIGPFDYRIEWGTRTHADSNQRFGWCNHNDLVIWIDGERPNHRLGSTLLHEILHAISYVYQQAGEPEDGEKTLTDEQSVASLAFGLAAVWRDNPAVMVWIGAMLEKT